MLISERAREGAANTANKSPRIILPRAKKKFGKPLKPLPMDFLNQQGQQSRSGGKDSGKSDGRSSSSTRRHRRSQSSFLPSLGFTGVQSVTPLPDSPEVAQEGMDKDTGGTNSLWTRMFSSLGSAKAGQSENSPPANEGMPALVIDGTAH